MKVLFDGGCRAGQLELAVVVAGCAIVEHGLGKGTSMDAEWLALIRAAETARDLGLAAPILIGDAAAVIAQARRAVRCPPRHRHHLAAFDALRGMLGSYRLRHVGRAQNLAGIHLARLNDRPA